MSPEIIQETPYDTAVDIWSLGITAIELAQMKPPHWEAGSIRALFLIATKPPPTLTEPDKWTPEFNNFLNRCLQKNPKDRPTAKELLQDPFLLRHKEEEGQDILAALVDDCFLEESERSSEISEYDSVSANSIKDMKLYSTIAKSTPKETDELRFRIKGEAIENCLLTIEGDILKSEVNDFKYLWFRVSINHINFDEESTPIEGISSKSTNYLITKEDIGSCIKCTLYSDSLGIEHSISAITDRIRPAKPIIKSIKLTGGPYFTRLFKLQVEYVGGEEGNSVIEWFKTTQDGKYVPIKDKLNSTCYQPTIEDVYSRLEIKYTPVRSDGEVGIPAYVISKPILKAVGRIVIYSTLGSISSLHAKQILMQKNVPYTDIDILKYPKRIQELDKLTKGKRTLPQLFFNDKYIGGLKELMLLEEKGLLGNLIKETLDSEPPEIPSSPKEEESEIWTIPVSYLEDKSMEIKLFSIYLEMRDVKRGVPIKIRGPITKRVKSFKSTELVKWIQKNTEPSDDPMQLCQALKDANYIFRIKDNHLPFFNDQSLYSFRIDEHEGLMLNMDKIINFNANKPRPNPIVLSSDMLRQVYTIIEKYSVFSIHKKKLHFFNAVICSPEYRNFVATTLELQALDISKLNESEIKAFFINVYNTLVFHTK